MKKFFYLIVVLAVVTGFQINAQIINIPADYPTIQQGIDASQDGDTVLVQPGTYVEQINYNGKNITIGSLFLTTGDENYIEQTIIDGNSYGLPCVRIMNGETNEAKLIGVTLQNGFVGSDHFGGGIFITLSSPVLDHLIIKDNITQDCRGGGISCYYGGIVTISNSKFFNNTSCDGGGALYMFSTVANITNCEFYNNTGNQGAGIALYRAAAIITNTTIHHNTGYSAFAIIESSNLIYFINSVISDNNTSYGIDLTGSADPRMINSIVSGHLLYNIHITAGGPFFIDHSIIEGGTSSISVIYPDQIQYWGNNKDGNPLFIDPANGDYRLSDCSPGIGGGTQTIIMAEDTLNAPYFDLNNSLRPQPEGSQLDIGAYENILGEPYIPPTIITQPVGITLCEGETYTMFVQATGSPEILYQWQKYNEDIPGETNDTLVLLNLTPEDEANYRCLVTNMCKTEYSNQAFIEIKEYPEVTAQPQSNIMYFGNDAQFTVGATGNEPLSYQWYGPSGLLEDDTLSQLIITSVSAADVGNYYCSITNVCGSATSNSASLTAYDQLSISAGNDVTLMLGDSTVLNGSYTGGSPSITIHWIPDTLLYDPNVLNPQTLALYSSQAFTLIINDLLVGYQTSDEVFITVIEDDTLAFFGGEADTLYQYLTRGNCGFISGNNCDLDKIKANYFSNELISYNVEKVLMRFGKGIKTSVDEVPVKVGIWSKSSTSETPGDLIDYQEVNLSQIVQDVSAGNLTTVTFPTPIAAPKDFYIGVFLPTTLGDTLALMTNKDGESEAGVAWTLNAANEWLSYSSDPRFFLRVSNAIFPVVRQNNVGINDFPKVTENILIYPNPVNDVLNIKFEAGLSNLDALLNIYDIQGKTMISKQSQQEKTTINIGNLNPGVYIIRVEYNQNLVTRKLIVY